MRCRYNFLKGYEFDGVKAASNFDEKPNSPGMDQFFTITVDTIPREAYIRVGSGHQLEGDGMRRFIFVLDGADDKESLEKKPLVIEELNPMESSAFGSRLNRSVRSDF